MVVAMKLHAEWRRIVRRAWSIRFLILAGLMSAAEIVLPYFENALPRGLFAGLSGLAVGGAFVTRLIAQKEFE